MARKHFSKGEGKYYFQIKTGNQNILISRNTKNEAADIYLRYKKIGKNCEWLGKWMGKSYDDKTAPTMA